MSQGRILIMRKEPKIIRGYVSEYDQFLQELSVMPGIKSDTRIEEEKKYKRIFTLRDVAAPKLATKKLPWKDF